MLDEFDHAAIFGISFAVIMSTRRVFATLCSCLAACFLSDAATGRREPLCLRELYRL